MDKELEKAFTEFTAGLLETAKAGVGELPRLLEEMVLVGRIESAVSVAALLLAALFFIAVYRRFKVKTDGVLLRAQEAWDAKADKEWHLRPAGNEDPYLFGYAACGLALVCALAMLGVLLGNVGHFLLPYVAPRVYLVERLSRLAGG